MSAWSPFFSREQTFAGYHEIGRKVPETGIRNGQRLTVRTAIAWVGLFEQRIGDLVARLGRQELCTLV